MKPNNVTKQLQNCYEKNKLTDIRYYNLLIEY